MSVVFCRAESGLEESSLFSIMILPQTSELLWRHNYNYFTCISWWRFSSWIEPEADSRFEFEFEFRKLFGSSLDDCLNGRLRLIP